MSYRTQTRAFIGAAFVLFCACHARSSSRSKAVAPATTAPTVAPVSTTTGEEGTYPVVLVHGLSGDPLSYRPIIDGLERGRTVFRDAYVDDLAALASGSVSRSSVFAVGYYKRAQKDPLYFQGLGSLGACPIPRTDGMASFYTVSYVEVLDEVVEEILRATGAPRVDMVGISQGGVVSRAYIKWRSGRGPNGQSRVRRHLILESPSRGFSDLHAFSVCLDKDKPGFMRRGEIAELSRSYAGWQGRSYIAHLNDGYDAWTQAHGVTYAGLYGRGASVINQATFQQAVMSVQNLLGSPPPPPVPLPAGLAPSPPLTVLQEAFLFISPGFNLQAEVQEFLADGDGALPVSTTSLSAGSEFPSAVFDSAFLGLHVDRGQAEEVIQFATNTREAIRRFLIQERAPLAKLVRASARVVAPQAHAPWVLLEYELAGGDGFSIQTRTEDPALYAIRKALPAVPASPRVWAAPAAHGVHRIRIDGEPSGTRILTFDAYDSSGLIGEVGPITLQLPGGGGTVEAAPITSFVALLAPGSREARVEVASNAPGAEFQWCLASPGSQPRWTAWSSSTTIRLNGLATGVHELFVRSRHAANAAAELVEEADPPSIGVRVDGSGRVTLVR